MITLITGPRGSGKTTLGKAYCVALNVQFGADHSIFLDDFSEQDTSPRKLRALTDYYEHVILADETDRFARAVVGDAKLEIDRLIEIKIGTAAK